MEEVDTGLGKSKNKSDRFYDALDVSFGERDEILDIPAREHAQEDSVKAE